MNVEQHLPLASSHILQPVDGSQERAIVGTVVGAAVGAVVGNSVGPGVGAAVGVREGAWVGAPVGDGVCKLEQLNAD